MSDNVVASFAAFGIVVLFIGMLWLFSSVTNIPLDAVLLGGFCGGIVVLLLIRARAR